MFGRRCQGRAADSGKRREIWRTSGTRPLCSCCFCAFQQGRRRHFEEALGPFGPEQDAAGGGPAPSALRGGDATPTHLIGLCAGLTELLLAAAADPGLGGADTRAPLRRMEALAERRCGGRTFLSGFLPSGVSSSLAPAPPIPNKEMKT